MKNQGDLFAFSGDIDVSRIFPRFKLISERDYLTKRLCDQQMQIILDGLGFKVGRQSYYSGDVLVMPVGKCREEWNLFEVDYPEGWTLTEDLSSHIYTGDFNPVRQLIDQNGFLRGILNCDLAGIPVDAVIYTRYAVLSGVHLNFTQIDFDRSGVRSIAIDHTTIDRAKPHTVVSPLHINRRWLLGEKYPEMKDVPSDERLKWRKKHVSKEDSLYIMTNCGSSLWLDENFPLWKDPAAYWPQ